MIRALSRAADSGNFAVNSQAMPRFGTTSPVFGTAVKEHDDPPVEDALSFRELCATQTPCGLLNGCHGLGASLRSRSWLGPERSNGRGRTSFISKSASRTSRHRGT